MMIARPCHGPSLPLRPRNSIGCTTRAPAPSASTARALTAISVPSTRAPLTQHASRSPVPQGAPSSRASIGGKVVAFSPPSRASIGGKVGPAFSARQCDHDAWLNQTNYADIRRSTTPTPVPRSTTPTPLSSGDRRPNGQLVRSAPPNSIVVSRQTSVPQYATCEHTGLKKHATYEPHWTEDINRTSSESPRFGSRSMSPQKTPPPMQRSACDSPIVPRKNQSPTLAKRSGAETVPHPKVGQAEGRKQTSGPIVRRKQSASKSDETASQLASLKVILANPNVLDGCSRSLFMKFDKDNSGQLDFEEMLELATELQSRLGVKLGERNNSDFEARVEHYMRKFDLDGDGLLNLKEFLRLNRWLLYHRYEELDRPKFKRSDFVGAAPGMPQHHYDIGRKLGEGNFGIVYGVKRRQEKPGTSPASKLRFEQNDGCFVMKAINKKKSEQGGQPVACLEQEIKMLMLLDHPHVLRLYEYYVDAENFYFITEICPGGELLDYVREKAKSTKGLKEAWCARVFEQVVQGIAYVHSKGVVHKDLKLDNLMLRTPPEPLELVEAVIIDVGMAELFGNTKNRGSKISGTFDTMAPEVLRANFGYKCDVWSLGCCLFALLSSSVPSIPDGKGGMKVNAYPFVPPGKAPKDPYGIYGLLRLQQCGPDMGRVQRASAECQDLIRQMLRFDESARPDAKTLLRHSWFHKVQHEIVHLDPEQVDALVMHRSVNSWRYLAMLEVATQLPASKLEKLQEQFKQLDTSNEGYLTYEEMASGLSKFGVDQDLAMEAARGADADGDGRIEWSEFVAAVLPASRELLAIGLAQAFHTFDKNGDGELSRDEILELLESGQISCSHMPAERTAEMMVEEIDYDGTGTISFEEFQAYFLPEAVETGRQPRRRRSWNVISTVSPVDSPDEDGKVTGDLRRASKRTMDFVTGG